MDINDVVFLIDYQVRSGTEPDAIVADVNADSSVDIRHASYLTDYLFRSGPAPVEN